MAKISKARVLDLAKAAVADRGVSYGTPTGNFERIAARWRVHLRNAYGVDVPLSASSVAIMMADLKLARLEKNTDQLDSWVDCAGYAACGANIACEDPTDGG